MEHTSHPADAPPTENERKHFSRKKIIIASGIFLAAVLVVSTGLFLAGVRMGPFRQWAEDQYFGRITEVRLDTISIANPDNKEREVALMKDTKIRKGREVVGREALAVGDYIIVVGSENEVKQIEAKVIRIFADGY